MEDGPDGWEINNGVEGDLTEENSDVEGEDVDDEDGLFGDALVGIKDERDEKGNDDEAEEFGEEVVGIQTVNRAVVEAPEEGGGEGDFDVLPGGFVDGGKEAEDAVLMGPVVEEVGDGASNANDNDAEPEVECVVHGFIIALMVGARGFYGIIKVEAWPSG